MPRYRYKAVTASSEAIEGRMDAATKSAVVDRIHAMGHIPLRVEEVEASPLANLRLDEMLASRRMSMRSLALVTGQLATLLNAGLALDDALAILEQLMEKKSEKGCLRLLHERIRGGSTLADGMAAQNRVFPDFYVSMVRAGEAGASLETVLERLADFLERREVTREHITSALLYPAIVAVTCCVSIAILLMFVVPRFRPLFEQSGDALPAAARYLLALSDLLGNFWWVFILIGLLIAFLIFRQFRNPTSRYRWERRLLRVPLVGQLIVKIEVARFSRTLGTLLRNGVSLLNALSITRETIRNRIFVEATTAIIDRTETGKGLAEPLQRTGVFPPLAVHLVRVGEESGRQEEMLFKIADIFEADTRRSIDRLLSLLAPALTVVLGLIVAGVIGTILTAVLSVYDLTM
jgi:general secretion pathway protein F